MAQQEKRPGESIDSLLRKFKRQVKNEGTLQELRAREYYEKPSIERVRKEKAAQQRTRLQQKADEL